MWKIITLTAVLLFVACPVYGCIGARAAGMGSAYLAVADDADAVYWNPAKLNEIEPCISYTLPKEQNEYFFENNFGTISSTRDNYKWSFSSVISLDTTNIGVAAWESFTSNDITDKNGKVLIIAVPLGQINNFSFGGWLGYFPDLHNNFGASFVISYNKDNLSLVGRCDGDTLRLGIAYKNKYLIVSQEYYYIPSLDDKFAYPNYYLEERTGIEVKINPISLRVGHTLSNEFWKINEWQSQKTLNFMSYGVGIEIDKLNLDYSTNIEGQRVTIRCKF